MKKSKKLYKKLLILFIGVYAIYTLINQQKVLNQYSDNNKEIATKIQEQKEYNKELLAQKENIDSDEFIEKTAREELDMYLPNEKVYIDIGM